MGQALFAPPNVKGWAGGQAWLNTATLLARHNFAHALVNGMGDLNEYAKRFNLQTFVPAVNPLAFDLRLTARRSRRRSWTSSADLLLPGDVPAGGRRRSWSPTSATPTRTREALRPALPRRAVRAC